MKVFAVKCPECKEIIYSRAHYDFHYCHCGKTAIDGGQGEGCVSIHGDIGNIERITDFEIKAKNKQELIDDWKYGKDKYGWIKPEEQKKS